MVVRVLSVFLLGVLFAIALRDVKMGIPFGRYVQYAVRKVVQMIVALVHFIASLWKVSPEKVADQAGRDYGDSGSCSDRSVAV